MNTIALLFGLSVTVLVVSILLERPVNTVKERFLNKNEETAIGIGVSIVFLLVIFAAFFLFFYSIPKQPNVIRYYNLN